MGVLSRAELCAARMAGRPASEDAEHLIPIKINIVKCPLIQRNDVRTHTHTLALTTEHTHSLRTHTDAYTRTHTRTHKVTPATNIVTCVHRERTRQCTTFNQSA